MAQDKKLVGVYEDAETAERVAQAAAGGKVGDAADHASSVSAEMREEMEQSIISPQAAFALTKESAKGTLFVSVVGALVGALLFVPLALFFFEDVSFMVRLIAALLIGAAAGSTIGIIVGPGFTAKGGGDPLAAEKGVVVSLPDTDAARQAMAEADPIRLDEVGADGGPVRTLVTEGDRTDAGAADAIADRLKHPDGKAMSGDGVPEA